MALGLALSLAFALHGWVFALPPAHPQEAQTPAESPAAANHKKDLKPGNGRHLVLKHCTACHSTDLILSNHMSRRAWQQTLTLMQQQYGMRPLANPVAEAILDYLEKTQGASGRSNPAGNRPWAQPLYKPNPIW